MGAVCLLALPTAASAQAEGPPPARQRIELALSGRVNPMGLALDARLVNRLPLSASDDLLLRDTHLDVAALAGVTPAYLSGGGLVELTPLAFLVLRASAERIHYFGTFGSIAELGGADADWSPERLDRLDAEGLGHAASATRLEVGGVLQAEVGPAVALFDSGYAWVLTDDVNAAYYEPYFDLLLDPSDAVWTVSGALGAQLGESLVLAGRWERQATRDTEVERQTAGALVWWQVPEDLLAWGAPEVIALAGFYLVDPYRAGQPFFGLELSVRF